MVQADLSVIGHANVPLVSTFHETLYETSHGSIVEVKKYRPKSTSTVYRYREKPIEPQSCELGKQTKGSILANLKRSQSMQNIICKDSWIPNNERLCKIRYYYRLDHGKKVLSQGGSRSTLKYTCPNKPELLSVRGEALTPLSAQNSVYKSKSANTNDSFFSIRHWHGAKWQRKLPKMYERGNVYDPYNSVVTGSKVRPSRFRDTAEM